MRVIVIIVLFIYCPFFKAISHCQKYTLKYVKILRDLLDFQNLIERQLCTQSLVVVLL